MSRVYLVRHGQAGTRQSYDSLSDLGRRQARLLGEHLAREGLRFSAVYTAGWRASGKPPPRCWRLTRNTKSSFPPSAWNRAGTNSIWIMFIASSRPCSARKTQEFRSEFETMRAEIRDAGDQPGADVHRRWTSCDLKIVQAWIRGHQRFRGETWDAFRERILACREKLASQPEDDHNIVVFTSATPIGIWAALGMDVEDHRAMRLAGVLLNASYTVMRVRADQMRLHAFNAVPHLAPELRTYR